MFYGNVSACNLKPVFVQNLRLLYLRLLFFKKYSGKTVNQSVSVSEWSQSVSVSE